MTDCIFCKIAKKEVPATIIYENDKVVAFDDIHPKAPIHKLIIPKKHIPTLNDVNTSDLGLLSEMFAAAKQVAKDLNIADDGYRILMNVNHGGGQVIFHIHLHLLGGKITGMPG